MFRDFQMESDLKPLHLCVLGLPRKLGVNLVKQPKAVEILQKRLAVEIHLFLSHKF